MQIGYTNVERRRSCGKPTFLVLNLALDVVDSIRRLDLQSDGLASQGLHENLHDVYAQVTENLGDMIDELLCLPEP